VIRTRVGYAGGTTPDPTYTNIGDYAETVQIEYDPNQITYEALLDAFWCSHNPTVGTGQYRSIIFYHNEAQQTAAMESLASEEARLGRSVLTAVIPYTEFYLAEDYHQKYYLRNNLIIFNDISLFYPFTSGLLSSTAAARLNSYVAGFGNAATAQENLDKLGLSADGRRELMEIIEQGLKPVCQAPYGFPV
jgi:methionine-S-sulfoxide reductase